MRAMGMMGLLMLGVLPCLGQLGAFGDFGRVASTTDIVDTTGNGLVRWWKLNEASGNSVDDISGFVLTNSNTSVVTGRWGNALSFNGSSSSSASVCVTNLNTNAFSISVWVNRYSTNLSGWIVQQWGLARGPALFTSTTALQFGVGSGYVSSRRFESNAWYHIVGTAEAGNGIWSIWTNGVLATTASSKFRTETSSSEPFSIGGPVDGAMNILSGIIDDVRIYDRVLTTNEIQILYGKE